MYTHRHTSEFNVQEVSGSQVLQKDSISGGSLKVEGDVSAGFSSEGREVEVGGRAGERRCVPVVPFRKPEQDMYKILIFLWWCEISHSLWWKMCVCVLNVCVCVCVCERERESKRERARETHSPPGIWVALLSLWPQIQLCLYHQPQPDWLANGLYTPAGLHPPACTHTHTHTGRHIPVSKVRIILHWTILHSFRLLDWFVSQ